MSSRPSFQFYPGDWMINPGLSTLDYFHTGVFIRLLCFAFQTGGELRYCDGGSPLTITDVANLLGLEANQTQKVIDTLIKHGCLRRRKDDGCLYNARMVKDCKEAEEYFEAKRRASLAGVAARQSKRQPDVEPNNNQALNCGTTKEQPDVEVWLNQKTTPSSSSSIYNNSLSNAPAREGEGDPDGIIVPKNMPVSPQNAVDMCLGAGIPDDFVIKAYNEAYAVGFKDRGNPIMSWKMYVTNYWNAHRNAQERRRKSYTPERPKDQYPNDRAEIPSL